MLRTFIITAAVIAAASLPALADTGTTLAAAPAASPTPSARAQRGAAFALRAAYHAIAQAQALGATAYLDAAKSHYREAADRYGRQAPGASDEAMAASSLALASIAEHPAPAPRDIPAPPALEGAMMDGPPGGPPMMGGRPPMDGRGPGGRGPDGPPPMGGWPGRPGFDAAAAARDAKIAATPEATALAQKALDADLAATRAAFAGNADDAQRQRMLAGALASAVRAIARAGG